MNIFKKKDKDNSAQKSGTYKSLETNEKIGYQTHNILGQGAFGIVYTGTNSLGQTIAIKCKQHLDDKEQMKMSTIFFRNELEALFNLNHPNIVRILGIEFKEDEADSLIMEYVVGVTVDRYIRERGPLQEQELQNFVKQLLDGLYYMHARFVMHRDIKSANTMIVNGSQVKIIDFGMAKHFDTSDKAITEHGFTTKTVVGTPPYMAPELAQYHRYNSKVDIWSVGVLIFEMVTGDYMVRTTDGELPLAFTPSPITITYLSSIANNFMQSCLIKEPEQRPTAYTLLQHPFMQSS